MTMMSSPRNLWQVVICLTVLPLLLGSGLKTGKGRKNTKNAKNYKRVCYFTNWSLKRKNEVARMSLDNLEPELCTHLIYAFANIDSDTLNLVHSEWDDIATDTSPGNYAKFNNLKQKHRRLKTLLSIGGATAGSFGFNAACDTLHSRKTFSKNVLDFLVKWKFDGVDLDWEYPGDPKYGSAPDSRYKFTLLIQELRTQFDDYARINAKRPMLISIAVGVSEQRITQSYDGVFLGRLVDFVNVMAYDFHGTWTKNKITGLNSPLFSRSNYDRRFDYKLSQEWAINRWIAAGVPKEKLVLGIAAGGRSFKLADTTKTGIGAPFVGPGAAGAYIGEEGVLSYYEVCEFLYNGANRMWDQAQQCPFAFKGDFWVGYDSPRSVGIKTSWMMQQGLGGVMVWSLDLDDFDGKFCKKGKFPLLRTVNRVMDGSTLVAIDWPTAYASSASAKCTNQQIVLVLFALLTAIMIVSM